jgi:hypothetical protein
MLQMLWQRGFIDPAIEPTKAESFCANDGKKDAFGNLIPGTWLQMMMSSLINVIQKETLLQHHGKKTLGVIVDRSPRCHSEVAGEGIARSWGCAKGKCRRLPLSDKRRKGSFRNSVRQHMGRSVTLAIQRQRMFSKRAHQCILACCHSIELSRERKSESWRKGESNDDKLGMSGCLVEKVIKKHKSHRGAADFDSARIDAQCHEKWSKG